MIRRIECGMRLLAAYTHKGIAMAGRRCVAAMALALFAACRTSAYVPSVMLGSQRIRTQGDRQQSNTRLMGRATPGRRTIIPPLRMSEGNPATSSEVDFVVVGSGLGGLSAGALLSKYGYDVTVCESHYHAGGCAHGFEIKDKNSDDIFKFDAGPSLWAGMSEPSTNPLRQVMDAVGAEVEWKKYDGWGVYFPDGYFRFNVGPSDQAGGFEDVIRKFGGPGGSLQEWKKLQEIIKPLILACTTFPPMALRADLGVLKTLSKYLPTFLSFGPAAATINGPFSAVMKQAGIKEGTFLWRWLDYLSFALSGLLADGTICAAVSYTLGDLHRKGSLLDYPVGGSGAVCEALVGAMERHGGKLLLRTPVEEILIKDGRAAGVITKGGNTILARKGVISNVPVWSLPKLLPDEYTTFSFGGLWQENYNTKLLKEELKKTPQTESFMHLHLGTCLASISPVLRARKLTAVWKESTGRI
eukprot:766722-Hanusia_phi.AAC.1